MLPYSGCPLLSIPGRKENEPESGICQGLRVGARDGRRLSRLDRELGQTPSFIREGLRRRELGWLDPRQDNQSAFSLDRQEVRSRFQGLGKVRPSFESPRRSPRVLDPA